MRSTLVVTTPASSLALLTIDELRAAAGITDATDASLLALGLSIAASIMSECKIAIGSGGEPTLLKETLTETFYWPKRCDLVLSRRHNIVISSIALDGTALVAGTDYLIKPESGILTRMSGGYPTEWWGSAVVVVYQAGFATVPADLRQAAIDFFRGVFLESDRDPFVKSLSEEIPGVMTERRDFWVGGIPGQSSGGPVPDFISGQLKRFRNVVVA